MMDKNSINEIDEKQENGAASIGENLFNTTTEHDAMTAESQDFHLVDMEESQLSQVTAVDQQQSEVQSSSTTSILKEHSESDVGGKPYETRDTDTKVVQDGGKAAGDENKIMIEAEKCGSDVTPPNSANEDEDIVNATPPEQLFSPSRQLLGTPGSHKRKNVDTDEPAAKISRTEENIIIPESQDKSEEDGVLSGIINDDVRQEMQTENLKNITNINDSAVNNDTVSDMITSENVNLESIQALSQALESVLDDDKKMEVDEEPETLKNVHVDAEVVNKSEADEKSTVQSIKNSEESEERKSLKNDETTSVSVSDAKKSRMSIEVIYDKALAPPPKPKELVEIDEDGEKIILDSSHEDQTLNDVTGENKSPIKDDQIVGNTKETINNVDNKLTNGNEHIKSKSDEFSENASTELVTDTDRSIDSHVSISSSIHKVPELLSLISDSEEDSFMNDEKNKSKTTAIEKEVTILVKVKYVLHVDEVSKDIHSKEVLSAACENAADLQSSRLRNCSTLGLGDISDGKDSVSPGSVTSNPRPYPLNPRFSIISTASSSSSSSSGSFKLPVKERAQFSLPRGVPKHAKKVPDQQIYDDVTEKLKKGWKNVNTLTTSLLTFLNNESLTVDLHNGTVETVSNTEEHFRSSTPHTPTESLSSPKSNSKARMTKRTRSQNFRNSSSNGLMKEMKQPSEALEKEVAEKKQESDSTNESFISAASTPSRQSARSLSFHRNQTPGYEPFDAFIGKQCFAKWGDNNYYPGIVMGKVKKQTKIRITFLDGLHKPISEEYVIIAPPILPVGLSIYAAVKDDPYGSCGIITDVDKSEETVMYNVETDEGEKLKVNLRDIFLTTDQVLILKETMNDDIIQPTTPQLGKITLDNIVEGSRRNKSPNISTPKSTRGKSRGNTAKKSSDVEPSGSGVPSKIIFDHSSDSDIKTSDSNVSDTGNNGLGIIQKEIMGNPSEYATKGPQNRLKGKARSKKKADDPAKIALLGPIPDEGSTLFKGMNFILTCASLDLLDRYKMEHKADSNSESGTDLEQEWNRIPFMRERLTAQITAGGGKVYEKFDDIPADEYGITKLITNVPNITAKSLLCLSVGIPAWSHQWVIRSCLDNELVNPNQEKLPAGWSLDRNSYIEMSDRPSNKPFNHIIIAVPKIAGLEESTKFWTQIIENAGGTVRMIADPSENFVEATAVVTNRKCPSWVVNRAKNENIPLLSTTWIVQCLVAGVLTSHESQSAYFHFNMK